MSNAEKILESVFGEKRHDTDRKLLGVNGILQTNASIHKIVGYNTANGSATLNLYYLGTNGIGTNLTGTAPVTLTTADVITLNGSYISIS